jgi:hypothetical protein
MGATAILGALVLSDFALRGGIRRALETVKSLSHALNTLSAIAAKKRADERTRAADLLITSELLHR